MGHPSPVKEENKVSMAWGSESKLKTRFFHSRSVTYKTNERSEYLKTFCIKVRECERVSWGWAVGNRWVRRESPYLLVKIFCPFKRLISHYFCRLHDHNDHNLESCSSDVNNLFLNIMILLLDNLCGLPRASSGIPNLPFQVTSFHQKNGFK